MIRSIPSTWRDAILVCGKCTKRVEGGFGKKGRQSLAKVLRSAGLGGPNRKAERGIIETGCLKLCPKKAVVVVNTAQPDKWLIVAAGTGLVAVLEELGIAQPPEGADR